MHAHICRIKVGTLCIRKALTSLKVWIWKRSTVEYVGLNMLPQLWRTTICVLLWRKKKRCVKVLQLFSWPCTLAFLSPESLVNWLGFSQTLIESPKWAWKTSKRAQRWRKERVQAAMTAGTESQMCWGYKKRHFQKDQTSSVVYVATKVFRMSSTNLTACVCFFFIMLLDVYENPPLHISSGADYKLETKFAIKTKRKRRTWLHNLYRKAQVVIWSLLRWFDIELQNRKSTIPSRNEVTSKQALTVQWWRSTLWPSCK